MLVFFPALEKKILLTYEKKWNGNGFVSFNLRSTITNLIIK